MGKIVAVEFLSLDGVMQAPDTTAEDRREFEHRGWARRHVADHGRSLPALLAAADALLLGRRTYEQFAAYWPTVTDPNDSIATALNGLPKYVVSTTLEQGSWPPTTVISSELATQVAALKQHHRGILIVGSATVVQELFAQGLVDELQLWLHPVVLGGGKRLFSDDRRLRQMRLVDSRTTGNGLVQLTYTSAYAAGAPVGRAALNALDIV
jgi:dihydrofolate reductase